MLMMLGLFGSRVARATANSDDVGLVWACGRFKRRLNADDAGVVWLVGDWGDG